MRSAALTAFLMVFSSFSALAQQTPAPPKSGAPAPPIVLDRLLQAPQGAVANWEALKGKVVILEFWATWCAPCVEQIPHLNALAEKLNDRPVQFISITDEDADDVESFLRSRPIAGWVGLDTARSMFRAYGAEGIPETVLVDRDGLIAAITYPEQLSEAALEELLAGRLPKVTPLNRMPMAALNRGGADSGPPALLDVWIRPSTRGNLVRILHGKFEAQGITLRQAVSSAHQIPASRIVAPAWFDEAKYDMVVAAPKGAESDLLPLLQKALEVAFRLRIRRETQETDVLVLRVSKGRTPNVRKPVSSGGSVSRRSGKFTALNSPLRVLTINLEWILKQPIIDETGLDGKYDFELVWEAAKPESLPQAVREGLGLELIPAKRRVEKLIVEAAEQAVPR